MPHTRFRPPAALLGIALAVTLASAHAAAELPSVPAQAAAAAATTGFDGVVEAVRQTVIAAQVPGAVVQLEVKVGDRVKAGQLLLRLDARAADQGAAASDAQVRAARASLEVATREYQRQQQLYQKKYISQAALDRAESDFKAAKAQADAQLAQAAAAQTQTSFHVVRAPYAGIVAEVPVTLGDMAMPGRPLLTIYDPTALRVAAAVPQTVAAAWKPAQLPRVEIPSLPAGAAIAPTRAQLLPTVDAATHTVTLRAELPADLAGAAPGMFARIWLPQVGAEAGAAAKVTVPQQAIVRRAEMTGLYVLDASGRPLLRQVRLGHSVDGRIEVLAGLNPGERVVTDPQAAARTR
jgi:RND family efflux transporter MFP subunit